MIWSHNVKIIGNDQPQQHCCKEDRYNDEDRYYEDLEEKEAVYRTAPATPGLLIIPQNHEIIPRINSFQIL